MSGWFTSFFNCRQCRDGEFVEDRLVVSDDTGLILTRTGYIGGDAVDLEDRIVAPGFLELHATGMKGVDFTHFANEREYAEQIDAVAACLPSHGVTGFYATVPTMQSDRYQKILPLLQPREIAHSASLLGAHAEGPYLHAGQRGAHDAALFQPPSASPVAVYGATAASAQTLKVVTLAPELEGAAALIDELAGKGIRVALGHSTATYAQGLAALGAGATAVTRALTAMAPLLPRDPGLAGLITAPPPAAAPYFTLVADGVSLHPAVATLLFRARPRTCILATAPSHARAAHHPTQMGDPAVTHWPAALVAGGASLPECVRNLVRWSDCSVAEAVRCVTENVAAFTGDASRGKLEKGRRADLVMLDDDGVVMETWVAGKKVWERGETDEE